MIHGEVATREAQIRAALSAGVSFLSADDGFRIGRQAATLQDKYRPFATLMQTVIRSKREEDITCADALRTAYFTAEGYFVHDVMADDTQVRLRRLALRHGFKMPDADQVYAAIDWRAMRDLLIGTPYMHIDLSEYLLQLPGAYRPKSDAGHLVRITFAGVSKPVIAIPRATLGEMGLFVF